MNIKVCSPPNPDSCLTGNSHAIYHYANNLFLSAIIGIPCQRTYPSAAKADSARPHRARFNHSLRKITGV